MSQEYLARVIRDFRGWQAGGGVSRAGLLPHHFAALDHELTFFLSSAKEAGYEMRNATALWHSLGVDQRVGDNVLFATLPKLISALGQAQNDVSSVIHYSGRVQSEAVSVSGTVDRHRQADTQAVLNLRQSLKNLQEYRRREIVKLNAAKAELEGSQGFLNGFLTGVTLGIHNPVKENRDAAKAAVARHNASIVQTNHNHQLISTRLGEIDGCKSVLIKLNNISRSVIACRSTVNAATIDLTNALQDMAKTEGKRAATTKIYLKRAKSNLAKVASWGDLFRNFG